MLAFPSIERRTLLQHATTLIGRKEGDDDLDVSQLDSLISRAALRAHGIDEENPSTASPSLLRRAISFLTNPLTSLNLTAAPTPAPSLPPLAADAQPTTDQPAIEVGGSGDRARPSATAAPAILVAPPTAKRQKTEGRLDANRQSRANPWICTCGPVWPLNAGNPWHAPECMRKRFTNGLIGPQEVGERVTITMLSAGVRRGQVWECTKVSSKGWRLVE